jgi:hypothetical protein
MLGQTVNIFIMAGKRKQLSNDIKNVIVEMRKSRMKYNSVIYCDTRYAWPVPYWILPVKYGTALYNRYNLTLRHADLTTKWICELHAFL